MTAATAIEITLNILQIIVLAYGIVIVSRRFGRTDSGTFPVIYMFSLVSFLVGDIYWIVYDILRPGTRMPIAADEIAGCAGILLLSSCLKLRLDEKTEGSHVGEIVFAVLYMSAHIALWIAWSGEWVQDILFGLPYMYMLYLTVRGINILKALTAGQKRVTAAVAIAIVVLHVIRIYADGKTGQYVDGVNYLLMYALTVMLFITGFRLVKRTDQAGHKALYVSFALFLWTLLVMYSSGGMFYNIAYFVNILTLPLMYASVIKEVDDVAVS